MNNIKNKDINSFVGKEVLFSYGKQLKVRVTMSMGCIYFLIFEKEMIAYVYEGKIHDNKTGIIIPALLYEL